MKRPSFLALTTAPVALTLALTLGLATASGAATTSNARSGAHSFPGTAGSVAALTGSSMEVQSQITGQVTVSWTTSTKFIQTVDVPASSVAVGDCVTVTGSTAKKTKVVTAKMVTVSQPTSGKCLGGFGVGGASGGGFPGGGSGAPRNGGGGFRTGSGGGPPGGFSGGGSGGAIRSRLANIGFAGGTVTAVTSTSLKVSGFSSASFPSIPRSTKAKSAKAKRPAIKATPVTVSLSTSTTYKENQSAAASALAVGDCVTAAGPANSTGAVTASSIQITSTGGQSCSAGFGAFAGGGSGGA